MKIRYLFGILALLLLVSCTSATTQTFCVTATATDGVFLNTSNMTLFQKTNGVFDTYDSTDYYISPRLVATGDMGGEGYYTSFRKKGVCIDTSGIPDSATVTAASASWMLGNPTKTNVLGAPSLGIVGFTPANASSLAAADGETNGTTKYATNVEYSTISSTPSTRLTIDFNSDGIAAVNKTGSTCYMATFGDWDIDSNVTTLDWDPGDTSYFNLKDRSYASNDTWAPWLNVTYTPAASAGVAFDANATGPFTPIKTLAFTDNSTISSPTSYSWQFKDYSNTSSVWNQFATTRNVSAYGFGAGNFSIRMDVTNATSTYSSSDGYYWANVSAGRSDNSTLPATYRLYQDSAIFNVKKDNLSVDSATGNSSKWLTAMRAGATTDNITHYTNGSMMYYVINDTILHQPVTSPHGTPHVYHELGPFPLPDDMTVMTGPDHAVALVDANGSFLYEMNYMTHQLNGTWTGEGVIWNLSAYDNRISPPSILDTGDVYRSPISPYAQRTSLVSWWPAGSMSGMPIFELYPRYEEVKAGAVNHSLTIAVDYASGVNIWPAQSSGHWGTLTNMPPAGALIRLKSSYDVNAHGLGTDAKVIAQALQVYGGFITENTGNVNPMTINIPNDTRWNFTDLDTLKYLKYSDFEFVDAQPLMISQLSYEADSTFFAPTASFTANVTGGTSPLNVAFTDSSTGTPTDWDWYWSADEVKDSDLQNPTHTFTTGTYNIRLYATNAHGGDWYNRTAYITVTELPVADFSAPITTGVAPLTVTFVDGSTSATSWAWWFDDGSGLDGFTQHTTQNPTQVFPVGTYAITLIASNAYGSDTETKVGYITVTKAPPVAEFSANHTTGNAPFPVLFTDLSTNTPTSWWWEFGDGGTSTDQNPAHTYATLGTFTVTLEATNAGGMGPEIKSGYISVVAYPNITYTPTPTPTPTTPSTGPGSHPRAMAVTTIPTIPNERYLPILGMLAMGDNETTTIPNWSGLPLELMGVYTDYMGPIAFLIVFLIPFGMMWLAHGNMKLLAILGFITCGFVFIYLPANYVAAAAMCMLVSVAALLWGIFKQ